MVVAASAFFPITGTCVWDLDVLFLREGRKISSESTISQFASAASQIYVIYTLLEAAL